MGPRAGWRPAVIALPGAACSRAAEAGAGLWIKGGARRMPEFPTFAALRQNISRFVSPGSGFRAATPGRLKKIPPVKLTPIETGAP